MYATIEGVFDRDGCFSADRSPASSTHMLGAHWGVLACKFVGPMYCARHLDFPATPGLQQQTNELSMSGLALCI